MSWTPGYPGPRAPSTGVIAGSGTQGVRFIGSRVNATRTNAFAEGPESGFTRSFDRLWDVAWYPGGTIMVPPPNGWARGQLLRGWAFGFHPNPSLGLHAYDPTDPGQWRPENA